MVHISAIRRGVLQAALLAVAIMIVCAYVFTMPAPYKPLLPTTLISIGKNTIEAEMATNDVTRVQGLSGRTSLPEGRGMLFVFEKEEKWGIWMKDMLLPLDIVWADASGIIVSIEHNAQPNSYPEHSFYPSVPAGYVLELPAGYTKAHGIAIGQQIVVK